MSAQLIRIGILFTSFVVSAHAQWLNYPTPGTPRTRDGKPDLAAKTPRASNGKPDLSGVWQAELSTAGEAERVFGAGVKQFAVPGDDPSTFSTYFLNILADFAPAQAPLQPAAAEQLRKNGERRGTDNPPAKCLPQGLPRADLSYAP